MKKIRQRPKKRLLQAKIGDIMSPASREANPQKRRENLQRQILRTIASVLSRERYASKITSQTVDRLEFIKDDDDYAIIIDSVIDQLTVSLVFNIPAHRRAVEKSEILISEKFFAHECPKIKKLAISFIRELDKRLVNSILR